VQGKSCVCTGAKNASEANCCHFMNIGREPYVTDLEMTVVARAVAGRGGFPKRRLPLAEARRTCPLLSPGGRCSIYEARPLGCRTFFCEQAATPVRKALIEIARRIADVSLREFPRGEGPRPLSRALAALAASPSRRSTAPSSPR
jgi:uncharacterized protein